MLPTRLTTAWKCSRCRPSRITRQFKSGHSRSDWMSRLMANCCTWQIPAGAAFPLSTLFSASRCKDQRPHGICGRHAILTRRREQRHRVVQHYVCREWLRCANDAAGWWHGRGDAAHRFLVLRGNHRKDAPERERRSKRHWHCGWRYFVWSGFQVRPATNIFSPEKPLNSFVSDVALDMSGSTFVVTPGAYVLDAALNQVGTIPLDPGWGGTAVDPAGRTGYRSFRSRIDVLDLVAFLKTGELVLGDSVDSAYFSPTSSGTWISAGMAVCLR